MPRVCSVSGWRVSIAVVVEEAHPDGGRVRGVDREVGRLRRPGRAERPVAPGQTASVSSGVPRHVSGVTRRSCLARRWERPGVRLSCSADGRAPTPPAHEERPWASSCDSRCADGVGTIRLDRPKMNALNVQVQEEIRAAAAEAAERDDVKAVVVYGGERVFAAGADIKEMADMSYTDMVKRSGAAAVRVHRGRADPEAGRRGGHRLRARRRLRARAVRRHPDRRRQRHARPARDPARHHPGRRRHPAADPAGRPEPGPRTSSSPAGSSRPTRRWRSAWSTRSCPPTRCTTRRWPGPGSSPAPRRTPCARPRRAIDRGLEVDLDTGLEIERQQFAALFATEDRTIGMDSFVENGPGKAQFEGR